MRAINKVPYEVVFSMLPRKEMPEGTEDHTDESVKLEKRVN